MPTMTGHVVTAINTRALGEAVVQLGGGRLKQDDRLDLAVGLSDIARIGEEVGRRHAASAHPCRERGGRARRGGAHAAFAFTLSDTARGIPPDLIHERIG
jgi:thymidine phosphorylase